MGFPRKKNPLREALRGDDDTPGLDGFSIDIEPIGKHCSICDREGVYKVSYPIGELTSFTVRFCWEHLPAEQRHYLRVNY